jgi:hypothetical protein
MRHPAPKALATVGIFGFALLTSVALAQSPSVSASINVNVPGIYGQINIGGAPAPELILPQPVVAVSPPPAAIAVEPPPPLYLHVPPGHEKHWAQHCHEYNACGRPVYFVSDHWYHEVYEPHRREYAEHESREYHEHEYHDHEHDHDYDHHDHHDHDHD